MGEIRKIAAILVSDVVGYSRLAGADENRTLSRTAEFYESEVRWRTEIPRPTTAARREAYGRVSPSLAKASISASKSAARSHCGAWPAPAMVCTTPRHKVGIGTEAK